MIASCDAQPIQSGNLVRTTGTFTNALDNYSPIDPGEVFCTIRSPDTTEVTYKYLVDPELEKDSMGVYYVEFELLQVGTYYIRWHSNVPKSSTETSVKSLGTITG